MLPTFIGPSYNLESRPASVQRTVNLVPVPLEPGNERSGWVFRDVPGLVEAVSEWDTSEPPPAAPVAGFYGLVNSGTASYTTWNVFQPNESGGTFPLDSSELGAVYEAQDAFVLASGAGAPNTFETATVTTDDSLTQVVTDPSTGLDVIITATTGGVASVAPGSVDAGARYSTAWSNAGVVTPSDGGSRFLRVVTNGAVVGFDFDEPMCGFGLYLIDYLDFGGTCTWRFFNGASEVFSQVVTPVDADGFTLDPVVRDGSVGFIGYVSNSTAAPFDSVTLTFSATASDRTGFDNIFQATLAGRPNLSLASGSTVQFTDTSTGSPTSWLWNFGDSTTSTLQNPTKTYSSPGTYTVTLTATNAGGSDGETRTGYIVVS
jgi:hypothetical protein